MLDMRLSEKQLEQIIEEAMIYMCACPAQVAVQLRHLRELYRYQQNCETEPGNDPAPHREIARAAIEAHALMEDCLLRVLAIEGWDMENLRMPDGLRRKRAEMLGLDS